MTTKAGIGLSGEPLGRVEEALAMVIEIQRRAAQARLDWHAETPETVLQGLEELRVMLDAEHAREG